MVVCVYLLGTAPVAMDTQDHDVKRRIAVSPVSMETAMETNATVIRVGEESTAMKVIL